MDLDLLGWPDTRALARVVLRLGCAAALGGLIGFERERAGKAAGVRTHMMVALGAALFVLVPTVAGLEPGDLSRVIQGIAAGMGFLGGGTILKRSNESDIEGLTSAATIWFTGAVGIAVGVGQVWLAIVGVCSAWLVLSVALVLDRRARRQPRQ
jgi:putative Mg2+ transporter-C (MgtC) family protein